MKKVLSFVMALILVMCAAPLVFAANDGANLVVSDSILYEGKVSVNVNTVALAEEAGIIFGATGLDATKTVKDAGASAFYAYIAGDNVGIGEWKAGVWTEGALKSAKIADKMGADAWAAAKAAETVELSVAFAINGNVRVWVNDVAVLDYAGIELYGAQLGFAGAANSGVTADKIAIEGGLKLKTIAGNVAYNAKDYTISTADGNSLGYFSNRDIKDGYIKSTFPVGSADQGGVLVGLYDNGSEAWEGANIAYYMVQLRSTNQFRWCMSNGAEATEEMLALPQDDRGAATKTYIDARITGYTFNTNNGTPCCWFFGVNKKIADLDNIVVSFKITDTSAVLDASQLNSEVTAFTDSKPFGGGFYGVRANKPMTVSVYAVNNEVEAMDIEIVSAPENIKDGGSIVVKTFPEGAVINSGDKLAVSGAGIEQTGDAVLNADGTYTINYTASNMSNGLITVSVDNHIYGTLSRTTGVEVEVVPDAGDDGDGNVDADAGADNGLAKEDEKKSNAVVWIVVAIVAVAAVAVVAVVISKKKK